MKRLASILALVMALSLAGSSTALATTTHCPEGGVKTESPSQSLVLPAGTVFCVKGSTINTGKVTSDGVTPIGDPQYLGKYDVSYLVVYESPPELRYLVDGYVCGDPRALFYLANTGEVAFEWRVRFVSAKFAILRYPRAVVKTDWRTLEPGQDKVIKRWVKGRTVAWLEIKGEGRIVTLRVNRHGPDFIGACPTPAFPL
jgi:hypothetical protein